MITKLRSFPVLATLNRFRTDRGWFIYRVVVSFTACVPFLTLPVYFENDLPRRFLKLSLTRLNLVLKYINLGKFYLGLHPCYSPRSDSLKNKLYHA